MTAAPVAPAAAPAAPPSGLNGAAAPKAPDATAAPAKPEAPKAPERFKFKDRKGADTEVTPEQIERWRDVAKGSTAEIERLRGESSKFDRVKAAFKSKGAEAALELAEDLGLDPEQFGASADALAIKRFKAKHDQTETGDFKPKTPEQLEMERLKKFEADTKAAGERATQDKAAAAEKQRISELTQGYAKQIKPVLAKLGYDPKSTFVEQQVLPIVGDVLKAAEIRGLTLSTDQAVAEAKEQIGEMVTEHFRHLPDADFKATITTAFQQRFKDASGADIIAIVGKEAFGKVVKHLREKAGQPAKAEAPARTSRGPLSAEDKMAAELLVSQQPMFGHRR